MSHRMPREAPQPASTATPDPIQQMEETLWVLEDLASAVTLIFQAGTGHGELTSLQCHGGMRIAGQVEAAAAEAFRLFEAIRDARPASDRGGV